MKPRCSLRYILVFIFSFHTALARHLPRGYIPPSQQQPQEHGQQHVFQDLNSVFLGQEQKIPPRQIIFPSTSEDDLRINNNQEEDYKIPFNVADLEPISNNEISNLQNQDHLHGSNTHEISGLERLPSQEHFLGGNQVSSSDNSRLHSVSNPFFQGQALNIDYAAFISTPSSPTSSDDEKAFIAELNKDPSILKDTSGRIQPVQQSELRPSGSARLEPSFNQVGFFNENPKFTSFLPTLSSGSSFEAQTSDSVARHEEAVNPEDKSNFEYAESDSIFPSFSLDDASNEEKYSTSCEPLYQEVLKTKIYTNTAYVESTSLITSTKHITAVSTQYARVTDVITTTINDRLTLWEHSPVLETITTRKVETQFIDGLDYSYTITKFATVTELSTETIGVTNTLRIHSPLVTILPQISSSVETSYVPITETVIATLPPSTVWHTDVSKVFTTLYSEVDPHVYFVRTTLTSAVTSTTTKTISPMTSTQIITTDYPFYTTKTLTDYETSTALVPVTYTETKTISTANHFTTTSIRTVFYTDYASSTTSIFRNLVMESTYMTTNTVYDYQTTTRFVTDTITNRVTVPVEQTTDSIKIITKTSTYAQEITTTVLETDYPNMITIPEYITQPCPVVHRTSTVTAVSGYTYSPQQIFFPK